MRPWLYVISKHIFDCFGVNNRWRGVSVIGGVKVGVCGVGKMGCESIKNGDKDLSRVRACKCSECVVGARGA